MHNRFFEMIQDRQLALLPAKLDEIMLAVEARLSGEALPVLTEEGGRSGARGRERPYTIVDGAAVLRVYGLLAKRMNLFMAFSGGTSTELLRSAFKAALADPEVAAVARVIDTPGGAVDGTKETADLIYNSRGGKPVVAYGNGTMASGAVWIGTAADRVVVSEDAAVGSIGVVMTHIDRSGSDKERGLARTEIYAGKYKRIASDTRPLTEEGRGYLQGMVDYFYSLFVGSVARYRGVDKQAVLERMADGRIFIGGQAVDTGLVDRTGTLGDAIALARQAAEDGGFDTGRKTVNKHMDTEVQTMNKEDKIETLQQLAAAYPELVAAARQDGAASGEVDKLTAAAVEAERDRVLALAGQHFGVEEGEAFGTIVKTGVTFDQLKAIQAAGAGANQSGGGDAEEKSARQAALAALQESGPDSPGASGGGGEGDKDFMTLVSEHQAAHPEATRTEAMQAVMAAAPAAHAAYIKQANAGPALRAVK